MAGHYSYPAAANYNAPASHSHSHSHSKQRGFRICDNCNVPETPGLKFRLCGGCMTTQYCSQECQKAHWGSHKPICQHTMQQASAPKAQPSLYPDENLARHLRKFTSTHSSLLAWAGFQALQLKRVPSNVRQHALLIELVYKNHSDSLHRFSVAGAQLVPRTYVTGHDPLVAADIQRREDRCRRNGGIGTAVVLIQCGGISEVMPVEVDPPSRITWDERGDWADVLRHFVESGRTDFKPVSTTGRGIVYG